MASTNHSRSDEPMDPVMMNFKEGDTSSVENNVEMKDTDDIVNKENIENIVNKYSHIWKCPKEDAVPEVMVGDSDIDSITLDEEYEK